MVKQQQLAWLTAYWFWKKNIHSKTSISLGYFGASTKIINGYIECGRGRKENKAKKRFELYKKVMKAFNLMEKPIENGCYN